MCGALQPVCACGLGSTHARVRQRACIGRYARGTQSLPVACTACAPQLDIKYDRFIRTTEARHEALVVDVLKRCWDK